MEIGESNTNSDTKGIWVSGESFARYAETDLDRWRQLIGHQVQHVDSRWGSGVVETVSWGSCCDHVPAYVQIKIRYEAGWAVIAHSETWHQHHHAVSVPEDVETAIRQCFDSDLSEEARAECLSAHARELRDQRDQETLDHAARMKQRILDRQNTDIDLGHEN